MNLFDKAIKFTEENEGGFVNDSRDRGGATIAGISSKWFPDDFKKIINASDIDTQQRLIKDFYKREFWNPRYEKIFNSRLAIRLFDLSVNIGKVPAIAYLQKTFNKFSDTKIIEDGKFGDGTLKAINLAPVDLYEPYIKEIENYYRALPDFKIFGKGWFNRLHKKIIV